MSTYYLPTFRSVPLGRAWPEEVGAAWAGGGPTPAKATRLWAATTRSDLVRKPFTTCSSPSSAFRSDVLLASLSCDSQNYHSKKACPRPVPTEPEPAGLGATAVSMRGARPPWSLRAVPDSTGRPRPGSTRLGRTPHPPAPVRGQRCTGAPATWPEARAPQSRPGASVRPRPGSPGAAAPRSPVRAQSPAPEPRAPRRSAAQSPGPGRLRALRSGRRGSAESGPRWLGSWGDRKDGEEVGEGFLR